MTLKNGTLFARAVESNRPVLGAIDSDDSLSGALAKMDRPQPIDCCVVPIVIAKRSVGLVCADNSGAPIDATLSAPLERLAAAAATAFQAAILRARGKPRTTLPGVGPQPEPTFGANDTTGSGVPVALSEQPTGPVMDVNALVQAYLAACDGRNIAERHSLREQLLRLGPAGARAIVTRLPGPVSGTQTDDTPLAEHGPLCALVVRFGEDALPSLRALASAPSAQLRQYVMLALGEIDANRALDELGKGLFDLEPSVRHAAALALRHATTSPGLTRLLELLRGELPGPDLARQRAAIDAVGTLRDVQAIPRLIALAEHDDARLATAARAALIEIAKQDFAHSAKKWRAWWELHRTKSRDEWLFDGLLHMEESVRTSPYLELRQLAGRTFEYRPNGSVKSREKAHREWLSWWKSRTKD